MATKWGIVSAGKISHDFVAAVRSLPKEEHQIIAVATRSLKSAEEFAQFHNIPKAYGSYEELSRDSDVEVVYVGTINTQHLPVGKMMLLAGKHVLMEKPMTLNLRETKQLTKLAKEKKCFLMEAVWSRFLPAYKKLKEELSNGTIGEVAHVNVTFGIPLSNVDRVTKKVLGGGTVLDLGVYVINALTMVFGEEKPEKIFAVGQLNEDGEDGKDLQAVDLLLSRHTSDALLGYGVDTGIAAALSYKNGQMATISTSSRVQLPCEMVTTGTKGTLVLPNPMWCSTELITPEKTYQFPLPDTVVPCNFTNSSGLRYEAMEVRCCLKKGLLESPNMKHSDSELLAAIMDEIRRQVGAVFPEDEA